MKLTALAVVILALGIVVGFSLAGGSSGGPASAVPKCPGPSSQCATPTPAPAQQREDQVIIFTSGKSSPQIVGSCGHLADTCEGSDTDTAGSRPLPTRRLRCTREP